MHVYVIATWVSYTHFRFSEVVYKIIIKLTIKVKCNIPHMQVFKCEPIIYVFYNFGSVESD